MASTPAPTEPPEPPGPDDTTDPTRSAGPEPSLLRDRRLLVLLIAIGVIALVVVAVVGFSGAYFTSTSRSPGNQFAAATMGIELAQSGQLVDGAGLRPGDARSGTQSVTNTGFRGRLLLSADGVQQTSRLARVLQVSVRQTDPAAGGAAYDGPLTGLDRLDLGLLEDGEQRTFSLTVTWPAEETDPALAGASTSLEFRWILESAS